MKALVYHGPGRCGLEDKPRPALEAATDALVRVGKTSICGTDWHILQGDVPGIQDGRILGHEGVGVVEEVGAGVMGFGVGDSVLISCITRPHPARGDGILGHTIDGTQAEYVRIPFADGTLHAIPPSADPEALMMLNGHIQPGDTVAIVGAGPVGLAALLTAQFFAPGELLVVDVDAKRLEIALRLGATQVVNGCDGDAVAQVMQLTRGRGVDVAVEAVGISVSLDMCHRIVAAGGNLAGVGGHGEPVQLNLDGVWSQNISLNARLVDAVTTPLLLKTALARQFTPRQLTTYHFSLCDIMAAYNTFGQAKRPRALKVIISTDDISTDDLAPRSAATLFAPAL